MALVATILEREVVGTKVQNICEVAFDNSYPTGGEAYTPAMFGLSTVDVLLIVGLLGAGLMIEHDRANKKLLIKNFNYPAGAAGAASEVANASDQSAVKVMVLVRGLE